MDFIIESYGNCGLFANANTSKENRINGFFGIMRFNLSCIANYDFLRWEEVFKDLMLTGAIVERLAHRAHIMDMSREKSYRMEDIME